MAILLGIVVNAQTPDPCVGAGATQPVNVASPCNCSEAQAGTSCNKTVYATKSAADADINSFLSSPQVGFGQPNIPVAWQDVRTNNMMLNGTGIVKHEFSTEFTTSSITNTIAAINICQVRNTCVTTCQEYSIIAKTGGTCGVNLLTPTLVQSSLDPTIYYRQYNVSPNTTYILSRRIYFDGTSAGCFTSWTGTDGSASGGAKITSQHWFIWESFTVVADNNLKLKTTQQNKNVLLEWQTKSENNVSQFEIQKSNNGTTFSKIGTAISKGTNNNTTTYTFTDNSPCNGKAFYRLKQIDNDGTFTYSKIETIECNKNDLVNIYPNPAANFITINSKANVLQIQIFNTAGAVVSQLLPTVSNTYNVSNLAGGLYMVKIITTNGASFQKLVKQ